VSYASHRSEVVREAAAFALTGIATEPIVVAVAAMIADGAETQEPG
jgi:hypothetical protein